MVCLCERQFRPPNSLTQMPKRTRHPSPGKNILMGVFGESQKVHFFKKQNKTKKLYWH
jgi:hypothetical protein